MDRQPPFFYETEVEWTSERKGVINALNLPEIEIAAPPEFKGHEGLWTPEHLFVAAVNTCFMTTFLAMAELSKLEFLRFSSHAKGRLERRAEHGYHIAEIRLRPQLVIAHDRDLERAKRLLEKTERNCLISNSVRTVVKLEGVEITAGMSVEMVLAG